jgi:hypothetical protein
MLFCKPQRSTAYFEAVDRFSLFFSFCPIFTGFLRIFAVEKPVKNVDNFCEKVCGIFHNNSFMSTRFLSIFSPQSQKCVMAETVAALPRNDIDMKKSRPDGRDFHCSK